METQPIEKSNKLLQNEILVETNKGLVCISLTDSLASNLNLSPDDLKTIAMQLILEQEGNKNASKDTDNSHVSQHLLSDTTVDSDDPVSDSSLLTLKQTFVQFCENLKVDNLESSNNVSTVESDPSENSILVQFSDSDTSSAAANSYNNTIVNSIQSNTQLIDVSKPLKRRGGWPKGRKRKPELLHLPPKAPATGYNLYLNEIRKQFKDSSLAFHEITKIIGNRWSTLTLEEKQPYLDRAEEDKRRYREELRNYRQSGSYQMYLAKKRKKRKQYNVLSESDMDATDDIDDEDNEELYCRTCDQWFHNLHNKREHLQGRQHVHAVEGDMRIELASDYPTTNSTKTNSVVSSTTLDESSLEAVSNKAVPKINKSCNQDGMTIAEAMANVILAVSKKEKEYRSIKIKNEEGKAAHDALKQQVCSLREREATLKKELATLKSAESDIELKLFELWRLPSLFVTTELSSDNWESEYLTDE